MNEPKLTHPKVSVLMPVYNVQEYVAEAIDSILNQTLSDFELIILDDCSTDNTVKIVSSYSDCRIILHCNNVNVGIANNLNIGLQMAKGKYIARMDGDDMSLPERLRVQTDFLDQHPEIDLCSCALEMFGHDTQVWIRENDPEQIKITMLFYSPILHAPSVFRRNQFLAYKLFYNQEFFPAEDYDLWSRAVFHCKMTNLPDRLYLYRIHGIQVTKTDVHTNEKTHQIRLNYLKQALPDLSDTLALEFIEKFIERQDLILSSAKTLKPIYIKIIHANNNNKFFNSCLLKLRLKRYYQSIIYNLMLTERKIVLSLIFDLRIFQVIKLIINKQMHYFSKH